MSGGHVLVTGGAGYVGSHACKALARAGYLPVAFDNFVSGNRWAVRWGPLEFGDILNVGRLNEVCRSYRPVAIMHFAASALVGESMVAPSLYYHNNAMGALNLIEAARLNEIRSFVFSSTCATYGIPSQLPIREDAAQQPVNPYGASKLMVERMLADYEAAYGMRYAALRYFNAAGADPDGEIGECRAVETHLIPLMLDAILTLGLAAAAVLVQIVAFWPFGPYQLSLLLARRLHAFPSFPATPAAGVASDETVAICLCVYNERAVIRDKVEDLLRLRASAGGDLEILVYVDCADDGTTDILDAYRDQIEVVVSPRRHGKTFGMNLLVGRTTASIVAFTDANVLIAPDAVATLRRYFADPSIGCVCSDLAYLNPQDSATADIGARYWRMNEWSKGLESATGSVIGADGSLFAIRRDLHRPVPKGLFDDIYVSLGVLLQGFRVVRAPELKAFETHTTEARDEFRRKIRIACECMHVHFTLWPELRRLDAWNLYKYVGHRLLRWIGGYVSVLGSLLALAAIWAAAGPAWAIGLPLAGAAVFWMLVTARFGLALKCWNVVLAFAGNAIGVWRALRGRRSVTWNAPESARRVALALRAGERDAQG